MVLISWFKELKDLSKSDEVIAGISSNFRLCLLDLLACSNPAYPTKDSFLPYAELSRTYSKMRNEASQLYTATEAAGLYNDLLSSIEVDIESLTADDALNFASKLVFTGNGITGLESDGRNLFEELESLKQKLLTTAGYLKCVQVHFSCNMELYNLSQELITSCNMELVYHYLTRTHLFYNLLIINYINLLSMEKISVIF